VFKNTGIHSINAFAHANRDAGANRNAAPDTDGCRTIAYSGSEITPCCRFVRPG